MPNEKQMNFLTFGDRILQLELLYLLHKSCSKLQPISPMVLVVYVEFNFQKSTMFFPFCIFWSKVTDQTRENIIPTRRK